HELVGPEGGSAEDRLVVDIVSPNRLHGRLAIVFDARAEWTEARQRALSFYAACAATAIDLTTAHQDAQRSEASERALLGFARSLAGVATAREVAQRLADAVVR